MDSIFSATLCHTLEARELAQQEEGHDRARHEERLVGRHHRRAEPQARCKPAAAAAWPEGLLDAEADEECGCHVGDGGDAVLEEHGIGGHQEGGDQTESQPSESRWRLAQGKPPAGWRVSCSAM